MFSNLLSLYSIILILLSFFYKNNLIKNISLYLLLLLFVFEFASYFLISQWIGYEFLINIEPKLIFGFLNHFIKHILILILIYVFLIFSTKKILPILLSIEKKIKISYLILTIIKVIFIFLFTFYLFFENNIFYKLYEFKKIQAVDNSLDLNYLPPDFVNKKQIAANPGKNIIYISVESLEKNFLYGEFSKYTFNINKLSKKYYLRNVKQNGASWTSGSLYTLLTSMPAIFPSKNNENYWFKSIEDFTIPTLGFLLNEAGYNQKYLLADPEFSGMDYLLRADNFDIISDKSNAGLFNSSHDKDLFNEAKYHVEKLSKSKKPFALFLSTIDTHAPDGIPDESLRNKLKNQNLQGMEYAISSIDYLLDDFLRYIENLGILDNTIFFIVPDHKMMGGNISLINKLNKIDSNRDLFLLTNFEEAPSEIYQTDLARLIVNASEIKTNIKFISDYKNFFNNNIEIANLNKLIINKVNWNNGFTVNFLGSSLSFKGINGENLLNIDIDKDDTFVSLIFDEEFTPIEIFKDSVFNNFSSKWVKNHAQMSFILKKGIFSSKIDKYSIFVSDKSIWQQNLENTLYISKTDVEKIKDFNFNQPERKTKYEKKLKLNINQISITSSNYASGSNGIESKVEISNNQTSVSRGLNLVIEKDGFPLIKNYDIYESEKNLIRFIDDVKKIIVNSEKFIVLSDDYVKTTNWSDKYKHELRSLKLNYLSTMNGSYPYICFFDGKKLLEFSGSNTLTMIFDFFDNPTLRFKKEKQRFIAHAGGRIYGLNYTNSLEALDNSYKKGIRLFELDIIKTKDNYFVAAHDWEFWKKNVSYPDKDNTPVSHSEFMKYKINNLTPLDMDGINNWFKDHEDAILVTDKVNLPGQFSNQFIDKQRLIMELFTIDAIYEAVDAGILSAMPTSALWKKLIEKDTFGNYIHLAILNKIEHIASSRDFNFDEINEINNHGKKIYAFGISTIEFENKEEWFLCNEMWRFYGLYVDNVNFLDNFANCK